MAWSTESTTARGYGAAWQRVRERALARDLGLCRSCQKQGRTAAADCVDHIQPKSQGGTDDLANLQCLCQGCHDAKSAAEEGRRLRPTIGLDGWPIAEVPTYKGPLWRHGKQVTA